MMIARHAVHHVQPAIILSVGMKTVDALNSVAILGLSISTNDLCKKMSKK
jgi:hypothetical protein